jgi:hypothetical protein
MLCRTRIAPAGMSVSRAVVVLALLAACGEAKDGERAMRCRSPAWPDDRTGAKPQIVLLYESLMVIWIGA